MYFVKFGMIVCFVSGAVAMTGATIWLIMFPTIDGLDEANLAQEYHGTSQLLLESLV